MSNPQPLSSSSPLLEMQMLGTFISAIAYGIVITLSFDCFRLLSRQVPAIQSKPMRRFMFVFISVMLLLSTLSVVQGITVASMSIFHGFTLPGLPSGAPFALPFTIWGADGFMLWRCAVLYQGVSRPSRLGLLFLMTFVAVAGLGTGIMLFLKTASGRSPTLTVVSLSTFLNLAITSLISLRLIRHQKYLRDALGPAHGSPYKRLNAMIVESAALIIFFCVPYIFLVVFQRPERVVFLILLPQICVISPLLIIYRVAKGRAATEFRSDFNSSWITGMTPQPINFNVVRTCPSLSSTTSESEGGRSAETKRESETPSMC
ncbi:hypothetical protein GALMADRAFT_230150 [Galerina marginata CBS 339.88]|uniref:G-protein coupled receptors family 1 profile domain-containing protein n=1 Tax=Galerina marginata (strain CBS 339.88) TaxID=685588 RepID=A0A067SGW0_GALM3|nr:hypothetical protein GALMADRAFT_230150 [Galerina marginata CBS 339.88]